MAPLKSMFICLVYTAITLGANPVFGEKPTSQELKSLVPTELTNFKIHDTPIDPTDAGFLGIIDDEIINLSQFEGKTVVLNFWATWCAPCRAEMPSFEQLLSDMGSDTFEVVTIAAGRNPPAMIDAFFEKVGLKLLPKYRDPKMLFATEMGVRGLPVTVLINPQGKEVGRLSGEAEWATPEMKAFLSAIK